MNAIVPFIDIWTRPDRWPLVAAMVSGAILAGAYAFEIFGGLAPCPLCIAQRWVHIWIILAGVAGFIAAQLLRRPDAQLVKTGASSMRGWFRTRLRALYALYQAPGALARTACAIMAGLTAWSVYEGGFHALVEYGVLTYDCQALAVEGLTAAQILEQMSQPQIVVPCDETAWSFLGISMAGYNALFSAALCVISIVAIFKGPSWRPDL